MGFSANARVEGATKRWTNALLSFKVPKTSAELKQASASVKKCFEPPTKIKTTPAPTANAEVRQQCGSPPVAPPPPSPLPPVTVEVKGGGMSVPVLVECEADLANVQAPDEIVEEHPLPHDAHQAQDAGYIAGYQRALDDMKIASSESGRASESGINDDDDDVSDASQADGSGGAESGCQEWLEEWDTLLEDLVEMGFEDRESNREAIAKHSGKMNPAVKHLVGAKANGTWT